MAQTTTHPQGYEKRWWALVFIGVSLLVISLDNTILNVAIPSISRQLGASASDLQWIIDAYILVFAALLLTMGSIGDRVGRKRALQFGLVVFGSMSLMAALSTSVPMLIVARALLGIGGATIMPATLSIVTATFRDPKERSQAIAIWAAVFGLGVGVGPVLGGWLLERFHWNSVFFINLPVVVVALIGGYFFITNSKDEHAPRPDIPGVILSITGLFSLIYGIIQAGQVGWTDSTVFTAFGVAGLLLLSFAFWESRTPNPMLPLRFFRNPSFTAANTALALVTFSMFGSLFFMSQYFQSVQGYTALEAGIRLLPMALALTVAAALSARVAQRLKTKLTVGLGILIAAAGMFMMSQVATADASYGIVLLALIILAVGMGTAMSPATNSVMGSVPVTKAGIGSAMNDTTRQLGGAMGVAVLGTLMNTIYLDRINQVAVLGVLPAQAVEFIRSSIQGAHVVASTLNLPLVSPAIIDAANKGFVAGMDYSMLIGSGIMLVAAVVTFLVLPAEIQPSKETVALEEEISASPDAVPAMGD